METKVFGKSKFPKEKAQRFEKWFSRSASRPKITVEKKNLKWTDTQRENWRSLSMEVSGETVEKFSGCKYTGSLKLVKSKKVPVS